MNLRALVNHPNVAAFLRVIREGESSQEPIAYQTLVGGSRINSFDAHPAQSVYIPALRVNSTAAGAYQFLLSTWQECAKALDLPDFSPSSQDVAAVFLVKRRGALDDVIAGRVEQAIQKCAKEWASLPGSPYGQPTLTMERALAVYARYGGMPSAQQEIPSAQQEIPSAQQKAHVLTEQDLQNPAPAPQPKGKPMDPFTITAAVELAKMIPKLGSLFANSEQAQKNVAAAGVVVDAVVGAVGAANAQEAIKIVASDPAAKETATRAVEGVWYQVTEAGGGGIDGARKASAAYLQPGAAGFWLNPSFWISLILIAMPIMLLVDVLFIHPESYVGELRTQIVTGVLMVIGMVGGYWIGTSISSARKDERATP